MTISATKKTAKTSALSRVESASWWDYLDRLRGAVKMDENGHKADRATGLLRLPTLVANNYVEGLVRRRHTHVGAPDNRIEGSI